MTGPPVLQSSKSIAQAPSTKRMPLGAREGGAQRRPQTMSKREYVKPYPKECQEQVVRVARGGARTA